GRPASVRHPRRRGRRPDWPRAARRPRSQRRRERTPARRPNEALSGGWDYRGYAALPNDNGHARVFQAVRGRGDAERRPPPPHLRGPQNREPATVIRAAMVDLIGIVVLQVSVVDGYDRATGHREADEVVGGGQVQA